MFAKRLAGFAAPTVWHEFTPLANAHKAVNLGQGFPNWQPSDFIIESAQECLALPENQVSLYR